MKTHIDFLEEDKKFLMALKWNIVNKKQTQGKGHLLDLARVAKISDRKQLKILTTKQMLQDYH